MAGGVVASLAMSAVEAWDVVAYEYSVADLNVFNLRADLCDDTSGFMTQHSWRFGDTVPFHDIAAADATGHDFHKDFLVACFGSGNFLDTYVVVVIVKSC